MFKIMALHFFPQSLICSILSSTEKNAARSDLLDRKKIYTIHTMENFSFSFRYGIYIGVSFLILGKVFYFDIVEYLI